LGGWKRKKVNVGVCVKKRFRRQEPAVWVSEREREQRESNPVGQQTWLLKLLFLSSTTLWSRLFCSLSNIFLFCFFFFSSAIIFFVVRLFSLTYRVASLATVFFFYTATTYIPAAGGSIPQCPTICSALRLLAASHCPTSLYRSV
jgi:hypothetical protein